MALSRPHSVRLLLFHTSMLHKTPPIPTPKLDLRPRKMSTTPFIDLRKGHPTHRLLPTSAVLSSLQTIFSTLPSAPANYPANTHPLQYGPDPGNVDTRRALARVLSRLYGSKCAHTLQLEGGERRIALTGGASGALTFVMQLFTDDRTKAIVLEPTYFFAKGVLEDAGFKGERLVGAVWGGYLGGAMEGLAETVREAVEKTEREGGRGGEVRFEGSRKIFDYVVYISGATFHNPTGVAIPEGERVALIRYARQKNMLIVSDDVYDFLSYTDPPTAARPPRFVDLDVSTPGRTKGGNTLSNGSWSKIFGGGIRSGWIETADELVAEAYSQGGATKSGGDMGHFASCIVGGLLEGEQPGVLDIIRGLREAYGKRAKGMVELLREELPEGSIVTGGEGGYFLWVGLGKEEDRISAQDVVEKAAVENLRLLGIDECIVGPELKGSRWIRLSVCWEEEEAALEGCKRLAAIARELVDSRKHTVN